MADIGVKLYADGEADFKRALANANAVVKELESEIRLTTLEFGENADSQDALTQKQKILTAETDAQRKKVELLTQRVEDCSKAYGEDATKTKILERNLNDAKGELIKMERELKDTADAMGELGKETADTADETDGLSGSLDSMTVMAGNLAANAVSWLAGKVTDAAATLWNMDEATAESREGLALVSTAFDIAGYSSETARDTVKGFYRILGDDEKARNAATLLAGIAGSQEDISHWTGVAAGVYATFGDSIPIEGLMEAINETIKTGKVTGVLADAITWAGLSEDEFNAALAACSTEAERNQMVMDWLTDTYQSASDAFYQNNQDLVASRDAVMEVNEANERLGESMERLKDALATKYMPMLNDLKISLAGLISDAADVVSTPSWTDISKLAKANGLEDVLDSAYRDYVAANPGAVSSQADRTAVRYSIYNALATDGIYQLGGKAYFAEHTDSVKWVQDGIYKSNGKIYTADWYDGGGTSSVNTKTTTVQRNEAILGEQGVYLDSTKVGRALTRLQTNRVYME